MQSAEEKKAYYKVIIKTCYIANIVYLISHIVYLFLFLAAKIYPLVYINIASIVFYCLCFILLKKGKYYPYALACGNEMLVYMSAASILVGFECGFHLCIIGLCVVSFFSTYFAKVKRKIANSITWCILSFIICICLFAHANMVGPVYPTQMWLKVVLYAMNLVSIFAFIVVYLSTFLRYAINLENRIITESRTDKLTQLHNRYDLYNYVSTLVDKSDYALSMFDIDDFKVVNDEYGHLCGDEILKEIAQIAMDIFKDDFVSRYGGEEFIIITKMNGDVKNAFEQLEDFRKAVEKHEFRFNNRTIKLTITIGLAAYGSEETIEEWIGKADKKLYFGKNSGKNQTVYALK